MSNKKQEKIQNQKTRKLSLLRIFIAVVLLAATTYASTYAWHGWRQSQQNDIDPWFGPYVDVTATPRYQFEELAGTSIDNLILSFIVADNADGCIPTWGTHFTIEEATQSLDLDRRIALYRQQGGNIVISFGGLLNSELAVTCTDEEKLFQAYKTVIDYYSVDTIDLDLEGSGLTDIEAMDRRIKVTKRLQEYYSDNEKDLAVWLTLPVIPQGLTEDGTNVVSQFLMTGVDLAGVNVMTMNYGQSRDDQQSMSEASINALTETHRQLGIIYNQVGISLNNDSIWKKIGATPMVGQNDITTDIFTIDDALEFNTFANDKQLGRLSLWSMNRDFECGGNYVNVSIVSDACSGVKQDKQEFSSILQTGFDGLVSTNAKIETAHDPIPTIITDNPETSPYQIWNEDGVYLEGTKVVWRGNVYQSKWWTQGDLPDNPVLQSWETPWRLLGPVLPGEKPVEQLTLPEGTYPEWSGIVIYDTGDRVLFDDGAFQAKWWTQGDSPAASTSNPDSSPWKALTQEEIKRILENEPDL